MKRSPDPQHDWSDKAACLEYLESFSKWATVIRMGDRAHKELVKVEDGLVFKDGEYYLPYEYSSTDGLGSNHKPKDGWYIARCYKKNNAWYSTQEGPTVNLYSYDPVNKDFLRALELRDKTYPDTLTRLRTIDPRWLDSLDLNLYRKYLPELMDIDYTFKAKKPVHFYVGKSFGSKELVVSHRNRSGTVRVDNSYYGPNYKGLDYGLILRVYPDFTNILNYGTASLDAKYIDFNDVPKMLDRLGKQVVRIWDTLIENNCRILG